MSKGSVYGSFVQALLFSASVAVPKYFLNHYSQLQISHIEALLIIQLMSELDSNPDFEPQKIAKRMNLDLLQVEEMLSHLMKKNYIALETDWNPTLQTVNKRYSLVGLIDQLADLWALEQMKLAEEKKPVIPHYPPAQALVTDHVLERIIRAFEQELARPITAIECEVIQGWISGKFSEELILGAFKRGVLAGIRNFRYIDSILREWDKKGLRTLAEVETNDADFQSRQEKSKRSKGTSKKVERPSSSSDKYEDFYL